jgi:hypothetical protein
MRPAPDGVVRVALVLLQEEADPSMTAPRRRGGEYGSREGKDGQGQRAGGIGRVAVPTAGPPAVSTSENRHL